jgi:GxxExxY protein
MPLVGPEDLSRAVIGAAIEVHRHLGPGLLESAYAACLEAELRQRSVPFAREVPLPLVYRNVRMECSYRLDFLVADELIVELKAVDDIEPIHVAQALTFLRLADKRLALILNFNAIVLKDGVRRVQR